MTTRARFLLTTCTILLLASAAALADKKDAFILRLHFKGNSFPPARANDSRPCKDKLVKQYGGTPAGDLFVKGFLNSGSIDDHDPRAAHATSEPLTRD